MRQGRTRQNKIGRKTRDKEKQGNTRGEERRQEKRRPDKTQDKDTTITRKPQDKTRQSKSRQPQDNHKTRQPQDNARHKTRHKAICLVVVSRLFALCVVVSLWFSCSHDNRFTCDIVYCDIVAMLQRKTQKYCYYEYNARHKTRHNSCCFLLQATTVSHKHIFIICYEGRIIRKKMKNGFADQKWFFSKKFRII
jgi:hypothetical protein